MPKRFLRISDLCKSFDGIQETRNVCLDIGNNEIHAVIGPNSAGKALSQRLNDQSAAVQYCRQMQTISYARHRFPPEIIQHVVWLYFRFSLSFWDVES